MTSPGAKPLSSFTSETGAAATVWVQLAASATALARPPRGLWCQVAGTITCTDAEDNSLAFAVSVGPVPISPTKVTAISGATVYALY